MKIYIASSWKNQHAVELLTAQLRSQNHEVISWVENNYEEGYSATGATDFEKWVVTESATQAFEYDTHGAATCELFIYIGQAGKDAAAECGICYGQRFAGKTIPMIALYAKGEDFGLMRRMFDHWVNRYQDLLDVVKDYSKPSAKCYTPMNPQDFEATNPIEIERIKDLEKLYDSSRGLILHSHLTKLSAEQLIDNLDALKSLARDGIKYDLLSTKAGSSA